MHDLAIIFEEEAAGHGHGADFGYAAHVVAAKVEKHQVLRPFFRVGEEIFGKPLVFGGSCAPRARPGDAPDRDFSAADADEDFGA